MSNGKEKVTTPPKEEGLRGVKTTSFFRVFNFELFVKPNKIVMAAGLTAFTGCVVYIAYMNAQKENLKDKKMYEQYQDDGSTTMRHTSSKWD